MHWNAWIRQGHRWLAIAFTLGFVANLFALGQQPAPGWVYALVLVPLFLLFGSGLYLFVLPYLARGGRGAGARE
ncbi:hypothetical protein ACMGDH_13090 [Sphingomonas sp. DT-207]|uniref:hypothetical protein n=1 Tax=Sphingomonas sp. DT-207 TaxID=3396167 RepID=UPI003F1E1569